MTGYILKAVFAAALLLSAAPDKGTEKRVVVIVNKDNPAVSISPADIKRVYLGKLGELGGTRVVPINQTLDSDIAKAFLGTHVNMDATAYKEYWVAQQVKGAGVAPMIQKTSLNVRTMIAQLPGAIGYVYEEEADSTVKTLEVK